MRVGAIGVLTSKGEVMPQVFFLIFLAFGLLMGAVSYALGGVVLMITGLSFAAVIVGALFGMTREISRLIES